MHNGVVMIFSSKFTLKATTSTTFFKTVFMRQAWQQQLTTKLRNAEAWCSQANLALRPSLRTKNIHADSLLTILHCLGADVEVRRPKG